MPELRQAEGREMKYSFRWLSHLLAGSVTLTSFWLPGLQEATAVWSIAFHQHSALVTQPWPNFSKATQALRAIRTWVMILPAFTPGFISYSSYTFRLFHPSSLGGLYRRERLCPLMLFYVTVCPTHWRPHHGYSALFSWSLPWCYYCCFFWDTSSCGESSFSVIIALSSNFD